jgi:signal transduction histidine kinase
VLGTRDEFLGMVSHDLRTMLGGISLGAALLAKEAVGEGERGAARLLQIERIQRFTTRMNRLLGDLLDVVSLEAGTLRVVPRALDGSELLRDTADAFAPSFAAKGVALTTRVVGGSLLATLDHERILQVLANLLANALKFTPMGGSVAVVVTADAPFVRFSVSDTGCGVPEDQVEAIFERFAQGASHDRRGLGLGLYIAKCIVEAHGGKIWLERPSEGGSTFHFTLPAVS